MKARKTRRRWILFIVFAVIMLPSAFTTVATWLGVSQHALVKNWLLTGLMLLPVLLRCFFLPYILCVLNGVWLIYVGVRAWKKRAIRKELVIGLITLLILLISFPGLEVFFGAMMGI